MAAAQHIGSILRQFNQQNLALALWAFAKLGWRPHTGLLVDACRHALLTVDTINPQNLSNILWALATMEFIPPAVLLEVCLPSKPSLHQLLLWHISSSSPDLHAAKEQRVDTCSTRRHAKLAVRVSFLHYRIWSQTATQTTRH